MCENCRCWKRLFCIVVQPYNGGAFGNQPAKLAEIPTNNGLCRNRSGEQPQRLKSDWCREWQPLLKVKT